MAEQTPPGRPAPPRGISPVLLTPFTSGGDVDEDSFVRIVDHVLGLGVSSVMFPGFASEVLSLSDAERTDLTLQVVQRAAASPGRATVIASVSEHSTYHATRRATTLAEAGVGALNVLPPHQLGPSPEAIMDHLGAVLTAVAPLPVIVQYAPGQAQTPLDASSLARLAGEHENLMAVKVESQPPGPMIAALLQAPAALPSLVGYGGVQMMDALARGAVGVQPGCSFTELYLTVWDRYVAGEQASAVDLHRRLLPYLSYWMQDVALIVAAEKVIAKHRGLVATEVCRAPARALDDHEREMVDRFCTEFADIIPVVGS